MDKETENTSKQNTNFDLKTSTPKNVPRHYDYGNKSHHSTASENEEFHISSLGYKSEDTLLTDRVLPTNARPNNHPDSLKDIAANFRLVKPQTPGDKSYHSVQEDEHLYHSFQKAYVTAPDKERRLEKKEKKSITTKTFAHGMLDVSLLTSNATQLRAILSNPDHQFYTFLVWLIALSVVLQVISGILLIMSDFFKTQVKEKDRQNQRKRKLLNFVALAMVMVVTALNILISAFYAPASHHTVETKNVKNEPQFNSAEFAGTEHSEL